MWALVVRPVPAHGKVDNSSTAWVASCGMSGWTIRPYREHDEQSWLRCRALSFLSSQYYDDVKTRRTALEGPSHALVAVRPKPPEVTTAGADQVVGILDLEAWDDEGVRRATIDTVATHPDHERSGIAGALLEAAMPWLHEQGVRALDAWTREDEAANAWYRRNGFTIREDYLHVYKSYGEEIDGFASPEPLSRPLIVFAHARLEHEEAIRATYQRVYRCRQYQRDL